MKNKKVFLNGKLLPPDRALLPINDRGLLYGDGVFESLRTYRGKPFQLEGHVKRLLRSARSLRLRRLPGAAQVKSAVLKTIAANNCREYYIKIILTRGQAKSHGLMPGPSGKPSLIVMVEEQKDYPKAVFVKGWKAVISNIVRPDVPTSRIKSLCYLNNVLARLEAARAGAQEALLLDEKGNLVEGSISNVFVVKHGAIYTPSSEAPILAGLTRGLVIKLAKQSAFQVVEKTITPKELYTADECFITFSGAGIVPITRIWNKKIGSGRCGYITESLLRLYDAETKKG